MLRRWAESLLRRNLLEVAVAVAIGYALVQLAEGAASVVFDAVAQHVNAPEPGTVQAQLGLFTTQLYFRVAGTDVVYGPLVAEVLALLLVVSVALAVWRARDRTLGTCPYCLSRVPPEATVCPFCTLEFASSEEGG